jgi:hypothetical protein
MSISVTKGKIIQHLRNKHLVYANRYVRILGLESLARKSCKHRSMFWRNMLFLSSGSKSVHVFKLAILNSHVTQKNFKNNACFTEWFLKGCYIMWGKNHIPSILLWIHLLEGIILCTDSSNTNWSEWALWTKMQGAGRQRLAPNKYQSWNWQQRTARNVIQIFILRGHFKHYHSKAKYKGWFCWVRFGYQI